MKIPLRSFGSNQVDFGGIRSPASATDSSSSIDVGYMEKAIFMSASQRRSSSFTPRIPPTKSMRLSVLGSDSKHRSQEFLLEHGDVKSLHRIIRSDSRL